jgi:RNA polymerase sigma factor (sigma-70 family)
VEVGLLLDASFEALIGEALPGLRRYARALTGDPDAAEDLVQDALVRVAGAWRRVRVDGDAAAYLRTVLFRTYVSRWRLLRRRGTPLVLADNVAEPADGFAPAEARLVLRGLLHRLPRLQRAVLVASYLNDLTDAEIATLIGRAPATVRSLRHRALTTLRAAIAPEPGGPPTGRGGDRVEPKSTRS